MKLGDDGVLRRLGFPDVGTHRRFVCTVDLIARFVRAPAKRVAGTRRTGGDCC